MGRARLGQFPSVMVGVRIPGEWAEQLSVGGKSPSEAIREMLRERFNGRVEHQDVRGVRDVPVEARRSPEPERPARVPRKPKTKVSARASDKSETCPHGFLIVNGVTNCPRCSKVKA